MSDTTDETVSQSSDSEENEDKSLVPFYVGTGVLGGGFFILCFRWFAIKKYYIDEDERYIKIFGRVVVGGGVAALAIMSFVHFSIHRMVDHQ